MTKSIKIEDQTHTDLEEIRFKRETYSEVVSRLIKFYRTVTRLVWDHGVDHQAPAAVQPTAVTKQ
jgi:predicted CopG family antitoxin